jgi:ribosomal protein S18 acetylase RimI-like enzyme
MLDKSIPYKNIIMRMPAVRVASVLPPDLPEGYGFRMFRDGDEDHWARIETSVLEFDSEAEARAYFIRDYLPARRELSRRCVFVVDPGGIPVGTATSWFVGEGEGRQATLHWVGVCPSHQGIGLGKAIVAKSLEIFAHADPGGDVTLHTQTWSHVAIRIYRKAGFAMLRSERMAVPTGGPEGIRLMPNDYPESMTVLKEILEPATWEDLAASSVP